MFGGEAKTVASNSGGYVTFFRISSELSGGLSSPNRGAGRTISPITPAMRSVFAASCMWFRRGVIGSLDGRSSLGHLLCANRGMVRQVNHILVVWRGLD